MDFEAKIFGKDPDPAKKGQALEGLKKVSEMGCSPIDGEMEKSPELLRYIEFVNECINEELSSMGLDEIKIGPSRIHLLPEDVFNKKVGKTKLNGSYNSVLDSVIIKPNDRLQLFKTILHETVHQASFKSFFVGRNAGKVIRKRRVGYRGEHAKEESHEHLRGLNEAVVGRITSDILAKNYEKLIKNFNITDKEKETLVSHQKEKDYMEILATVLEGVAQKNGESATEAWKRFKLGEFTGEMMHLRDVESAFGKGSLRVLAALDSGTKRGNPHEIRMKILDYFRTDDEKQKKTIANQILVERERLRLEKRQKSGLE